VSFFLANPLHQHEADSAEAKSGVPSFRHLFPISIFVMKRLPVHSSAVAVLGARAVAELGCSNSYQCTQLH
jgi:hypothetical protein